MKKPSFLIYLAGLLALAPALGFTVAGASDHLRAANAAFFRFDDAKALTEYEKALALEPSCFEALSKSAQASLNVGDRLIKTSGDTEAARQRFFRSAEQYALKALAVRPDDSQAHFLYAAALGRQVSTFGRKDQIAAANRIKGELDKAVALDPKNDMAWNALAYWNRTLAEMSGSVRFLGGLFYGRIPKGSYDEAVRGFQRAIALNPDYADHHLELAITYLDLKKKPEAASELRAALDCPEQTSQCARFKGEAKRALDRLTAADDISGALLAAAAPQQTIR
jgi:tetratricopeptide (TPR) repeat protein